MSTFDKMDIDVLETILETMPKNLDNSNLLNAYNKIIKLVEHKDKTINEYKIELEQKDCNIEHQEKVIKNQIEEICLLHHALESYNYYPSHPMDSYMIEFGYSNWHKLNYRMCISTRKGEKIIKWVSKRKFTGDAIKSFKRYLKEINYKTK
jgi:hypothetical protein